MTRGRFRHDATALVLSLVLAAQAAWIFVLILQERGEFGWDPAQHTLWGLLIYQDIVGGKWISFLIDTYRQVYWPFLQSWLIALSMLSFGPTAVASRLVSLIAYAITGTVLGLLARRAAPERPLPAICVAVGLWLTMTNYVFRYATESFAESAATAVTAVSLLALARALERNSAGAYVWAGTAAMLTYFAKTGYGIVLILATVVAMLLYHRRYAIPAFRRSAIAYSSPIAALGALWFAYPPKIMATAAALMNRKLGPDVLSMEGLLYHLEQLVKWCDGGLAPGGVIAAGLAVCFVVATRLKKNALLYLVVTYVAVAFALHTASQTNDTKHIVKVVPWVFLLLGWQAGVLWEVAHKAQRWRPGLKVSLVSVAFAVLGLRAAMLVGEVGRRSEPVVEPVRRAIVEAIDDEHSHLVLGEFSSISPHLISWHLLTSGGDVRSAAIVPDPIHTKNPKRRKEYFDRVLADLSDEWPILGWLERVGPKRTYRVTHLFTKRNQDDPADPSEVLRNILEEADDPDRVIVLVVDRSSRFFTEDYIELFHPGHAFVPLLEAHPDYGQKKVVRFAADGLYVHIFDRSLARSARSNAHM
jgi:hypothetical protein